MNGQCLCGAVHITIADTRETSACHCGMCRRWCGGPALSLHAGNEASFTGEDNIAVHASSEWAERAFCKRCGTHLYYKLKATNEYFVSPGLFDEQDFDLTMQVYIDMKPPYYDFANDTPTMTEQQVMAHYSQP